MGDAKRTERAGMGLPYWVMAWVWAALVGYGSMLPFAALTWAFRWPGWGHGRLSLDDGLTNLVLYVPLGAMLRLHAWQRGRGVGFALMVVGLMPFGVECVQGMMPGRYGSWRDVLLNAGGGAAGALLAVPVRAGVRAGIVWGWRRAIELAEGGYRVMWRLRLSPWLRGAIVVQHVMLVSVWAWRSAQGPGGAWRVRWLPFGDLFELDYLDAAARGARFALATLVMGLPVAVQWLRPRRWRSCAGWAGYLVVLMAVREGFAAGWRGGWMTTTRPTIALLVGVSVPLALWVVRHMIAASNRRKQAAPVAHERRRSRFVAPVQG